jgi:hypothetical protein
MRGGGQRVRARCAWERRSVPTGYGCMPERNSGLGMTDPIAPRPTAAEQVEENLQQMKRCLTGDGVRGRATVVSGDPVEATLHLATRPPLARL